MSVPPADDDERKAAAVTAATTALAPAALSGLVMTRGEWTAMVLEDPQADPFWPESWLGRIDPLAGRSAELGEEDHTPPPAGLLTGPA